MQPSLFPLSEKGGLLNAGHSSNLTVAISIAHMIAIMRSKVLPKVSCMHDSDHEVKYAQQNVVFMLKAIIKILLCGLATLIKTSSIAVKTSQSTPQSDSIGR